MDMSGGGTALPPATSEGTRVGGVSSKWTVVAPGKCAAPKSDDYGRWTIQQLRKECSARHKAIPRTVANEKAVRVATLQESDGEPVVRAVKDDRVIAIRPAGAVFSDKLAGSFPFPTDDGFFRKLDTNKQIQRPASPVTDFGGRVAMPEAWQLDSTKPMMRAIAKPQAKRASARSEEVDLHSTLKLITNYVTRKIEESPQSPPPVTAAPAASGPSHALTVLECLSKSYGILQQLKTTTEELKRHGSANAMLEQSLALHEAGVRKLEQDYAECLGIARPPKRVRVAVEDSYRG